jgi:hypothetical protein
MTRGRVGIAALGVLVLALLGIGLWKHQTLTADRDAAHRRTARARGELRTVTAEMRELRAAAGSLETDNAETRRLTDELIGVTATVTAQIDEVQHARDDAALAAWLAAGQVPALRECLAGVNRALNQVSVGDPRSVTTLVEVQTECRSVGA